MYSEQDKTFGTKDHAKTIEFLNQMNSESKSVEISVDNNSHEIVETIDDGQKETILKAKDIEGLIVKEQGLITKLEDSGIHFTFIFDKN